MNHDVLLKKNNYLIAAIWIISLNFISTANDVVCVYVGKDIDPFQISFIRSLITILSILPFMGWGKKNHFKTKILGTHMLRAILGTIFLITLSISVTHLPLLENTCILFTEPILLLPLSAIFLNEKVDTARVLVTIAGFLGILIVAYQDILNLNIWVIFPIICAISVAFQSIIAKKITLKEPLVTLLFYFGLFTTILSFPPAVLTWKKLTTFQIFLLIIYGINGNLMQICMFQAYKASDVSALMPLRYSEFLFALIAGFVFFSQIPTIYVLTGSVIIISASLAIMLIETSKEKKIKKR